MTTQSIEQRLTKIERQNKWLILICVLLSTVPFLLGQVRVDVDKPILGQLGKVTPPVGSENLLSKEMRETLGLSNVIQPIVKTKLLCLVDSKGKVRATLSTTEAGEPTLALYNANGTSGAVLTTVELESGLAPRPNLTLSRSPQGVSMHLSTSSLTAFESPGFPKVQMGTFADSKVGMIIKSNNSILEIGGGNNHYIRMNSTPNAVKFNLKQQNRDIFLGCGNLGSSGNNCALMTLKQDENAPFLNFYVGDDGRVASCEAKIPGTLYKASLFCRTDSGGNLWSRQPVSPETDQIFWAHARQIGPTRSAHLSESPKGR